MLLAFKGVLPAVGDDVFIAGSAEVIGSVTIGDGSSVWFQSVVRGDVEPITIGTRTNIQDHCVLHVTGGLWPLVIGDEVTVGHRVVLHGCTIESRVLVGIGSIVLDGAIVEEGSMVGAGSVVPPGFRVPAGTLVMGIPARVKRELSATETEHITRSAANYSDYARIYVNGE